MYEHFFNLHANIWFFLIGKCKFKSQNGKPVIMDEKIK